MKKSNTPHGLSLSPEFKEISKRLKRKEPELDALVERAVLRCFECGESATYKHHVIPKSMGGGKTLPLCGTCHAKIHGDHIMETAELTRKAMERNKAAGKKTGGHVPYGYDVDENGFLIPNEHEQEVIGYIKTWKGQGCSLRDICGKLERGERPNSQLSQEPEMVELKRMIEAGELSSARTTKYLNE